MGDMCVSFDDVKKGFVPMLKAMDKASNDDRKVCRSEMPDVSEENFVAFVNTIRIKPATKEVLMLELPEMLEISKNVSISEGEITVGLFKKVMGKYRPKGHNAKELQAILDDPSKEGSSLEYVSLIDARKFVNRLSQLTGRHFRIQTMNEWYNFHNFFSGENWTWTETKWETHHKGDYALMGDYEINPMKQPDRRYPQFSIRIVEDK
jgi:hypothetical protein